MLDIGVAIGQQLASRAAVDFLIRQIAKSCFPNRPSALAFDGMGLGKVTEMPASSQAGISCPSK